MTESTLTCPSDRIRDNKWRPNTDADPLTKEEAKEAYKDLVDVNFVKKYRLEDRKFSDPFPPMQKYCLVSFVPAQGATPNEKGVFGMAKVRGSYEMLEQARERAEFLIRYVDSTHPVRIGYVGTPFPITSSSEYTAEIDQIDLQKEVNKIESQNRKSAKLKDQQVIDEIKSREEKILEDNEKILDGTYEEDPYDNYITLRVKKAQLIFTVLEHAKKLDEMKDILVKTIKDVEDLDEVHPTYKNSYFEKYDQARKKAGLDKGKSEENFVKFMIEDVRMPDIEEMFLERYGVLPKTVQDLDVEEKEEKED